MNKTASFSLLIYCIAILFTAVPAQCHEDVPLLRPSSIYYDFSGITFSKVQYEKKIAGILHSKDYDELERIANNLRESREQYIDGTWKIEIFYRGVSELNKKATVKNYDELIGILNQWVRARPQSITAKLALANAISGKGWAARGYGFSKTVKQPGWAMLKKCDTDALNIIGSIPIGVRKQYPFSYALQLNIAKTANWPKAKVITLFNDCQNLYPKYCAAYRAVVLHLTPKWKGRPGESEAFLLQACSTLNSPIKEMIYAHCVNRFSSNYKNVYKQSKFSYPLVKQGYESMRRFYPQNLDIESIYARHAWLAGDKKTAVPAMRRINGYAPEDIWLNGENFKKALESLYEKDYAKKVKRIDKAIKERSEAVLFKQSKELLSDLESKYSKDPLLASEYLHMAKMRQHTKYGTESKVYFGKAIASINAVQDPLLKRGLLLDYYEWVGDYFKYRSNY